MRRNAKPPRCQIEQPPGLFHHDICLDYDGAIDAFLQSVDFARNEYAPVANFWLGKSYMAKWKNRSHNEDGKAIEAFKKSVEQTIALAIAE